MLACATISKNEYECPGDSLRDLLDAANSAVAEATNLSKSSAQPNDAAKDRIPSSHAPSNATSR